MSETLKERIFIERVLSRYEVLVYGMKFKMFGTWFKLVDVELYEVEHCEPPEQKVVSDGLPY